MSERKRIEAGYCRRKACGRLHDNCVHTQTGDRYCEHCAIKINRANPEVPNLVTIPRLTPPTRDWKPGEEVLVPGAVFSGNVLHGEILVQFGKTSVWFPLSSIRPIRKEGE